MSDMALDQIVEMAFKLSVAEQAKLLERVAAHLASEVTATDGVFAIEDLSRRAFEVWSPQDEGGAIAALNQALEEHRSQKRAQNGG